MDNWVDRCFRCHKGMKPQLSTTHILGTDEETGEFIYLFRYACVCSKFNSIYCSANQWFSSVDEAVKDWNNRMSKRSDWYFKPLEETSSNDRHRTIWKTADKLLVCKRKF